jgi:DNA polymerase-3 subunit gamma/tau
MLKTLEEPPAHVKFILATTDPQKIPVTVLSRCLQFNLKQLSPALILEHMQYVLGEEKIPFEIGALQLLARAAQGSMRDALSLLDQAIAYSLGKVDEAIVRSMLGAIDQSYLFDLLAALRAGNGVELLRIADDMALRSIAFEAALQDLASLLHRIALAQTVPQAIAEDEPERGRLLALAQQFSAEEIQLNYQIAIHGRNEIELAPDEYAGFTMTLLRMLAFVPQSTTAVMEARQPVTPRKVIVPVVSEPVPPTRVIVEPIVLTSAPVAVEVPIKPLAQLKAQMPTDLDWNALLSQLKLQAMALQLAKNCVLVSFADSRLVLHLAPSKKISQTKMAQENLQSALSEYFGQPIRLAIELAGNVSVVTPAVVEQQVKQARQEQADLSIANDNFVRQAQAELGANIVENSIKSN